MKRYLFSLIVAGLISAAATAKAEPGLETLSLKAAQVFAEAGVAANKLPAFNTAPLPVRRRVIRRRRQFPDRDCLRLPHVYERDGRLYVNGEEVARNTAGHAASCSGDVVWKDSRGQLFKNGELLAGGERAARFIITRYSGDVIFENSRRELFKNSQELTDGGTSMKSYKFSHYTGDVAWEGSFGRLYKNDRELSPSSTSVERYEIAGFTGEVVWQGSFSRLYKEGEELGNAERWAVAYTGDVAWEDGFRRLYKNKSKVAESSQRWTLRPDGLLIWWDSRGDQHSR